jgi:carbamoyltransferase
MTAAALVTDGDIIAAARGVAHNCVANGRLLATGLFDDVFVAPASGDAGGALGAALLASHHVAGHPRVTLAAALAEGRIIGWFQGAWNSDRARWATAAFSATLATRRCKRS